MKKHVMLKQPLGPKKWSNFEHFFLTQFIGFAAAYVMNSSIRIDEQNEILLQYKTKIFLSNVCLQQ